MTKADLVKKVYERVGQDADKLTKKVTEQIIEETFNVIKESFQEGEERFVFPKFGTFSVKERSARTGRNPRTGEEITIPAYKTVTFKPASQFKEMLNK